MKKQTIKLSEAQLHRVIKESVRKVLRETNDVDLPFVYGDPDSSRSGTCSGEELGKYWKSIGKHYNQVYPTKNGVDLYTLNTENGKNPVYFGNKAEAVQWIKDHIEDAETANVLYDALKQYRMRGGRYIERNV